jgi:hypothetical protein
LVANFFVWKIVFAHNLFNLSPFLEGLLADLFDAVLAEILKFCFVGITYVAEVFKMDVDD